MWNPQQQSLLDTDSALNRAEFFYVMPRNQIDKDSLKCHILELKRQVDHDEGYPGEKAIAQKYLNKVLDKIEEYRL